MPVSRSAKYISKSIVVKLGICNFGSNACKMLIDGYIIHVDYTELQKLCTTEDKTVTGLNWLNIACGFDMPYIL